MGRSDRTSNSAMMTLKARTRLGCDKTPRQYRTFTDMVTGVNPPAPKRSLGIGSGGGQH